MARRAKPCPLCESGIRQINYKDEHTLSRFMTEAGKIMPRRMTGMCARHQRQVGTAAKRARYLALAPYTHVYES
ncbi:MAG TPA: 30S ribosomal protein S18 [Longimicrobiales bacterium]|nr:30S ribosomal protein S18 [Longimicrobiales bacterium]